MPSSPTPSLAPSSSAPALAFELKRATINIPFALPVLDSADDTTALESRITSILLETQMAAKSAIEYAIAHHR